MKGGVVFKMPLPTPNDIKNYGDYDAYLKNAIYPNKQDILDVLKQPSEYTRSIPDDFATYNNYRKAYDTFSNKKHELPK